MAKAICNAITIDDVTLKNCKKTLPNKYHKCQKAVIFNNYLFV